MDQTARLRPLGENRAGAGKRSSGGPIQGDRFRLFGTVEGGMYSFGGHTYAVVSNKAGTNLYAKQLIVVAGHKPKYEYAPGMMAKLKAAHRMTIDAGTVLSGQIGACCVCTRTLTVAKSVAAGIGPKCAKMFA